MQSVKVKHTVIGEGIPKICIPVTGKTAEEICEQTKKILELEPDLAEWRIDCWEEKAGEEKICEMLRTITDILGEIPLLFTFRTAAEGGARPIGSKDYVKLLKTAAKTGFADLIDIEVFSCKDQAEALIGEIQQAGARVVASNHHFDRTPSRDEIFERLEAMEAAGADILKLAVMPKDFSDVCCLLEATNAFAQKTQRPLITMSMGKTGVLSRLCGEITGSSVTFGAGVNASAPGQVPAEKLRQILTEIHELRAAGETEEN